MTKFASNDGLDRESSSAHRFAGAPPLDVEGVQPELTREETLESIAESHRS
ncbi:MAG: hypothetical protein JXB85_11345 [Anaerolineales bacterium]|nr:hypothetical protein [Anaerolineales bacterium]